MIRALRRAHDWTQEELAERAELHPNTVSGFEREGQRPGTEHETLKKLAAAMDPPLTVDAVEVLVEFLDEQGALPAGHLSAMRDQQNPVTHTPAEAHGGDREHKWLLESFDYLDDAEKRELKRWMSGMLLRHATGTYGGGRPPSRRKRR